MKELNNIESIEAEFGEIEVNSYLTYAQIQAIADKVGEFDTWSERQENLDILLVHFATNLTNDKIQEIGHVNLLCSGLIDKIKQTVKNFEKIEEAITYNESVQRALAKIVKELPTMLEPLKDVANRVNKPSKK